jgi:hypothetical protein
MLEVHPPCMDARTAWPDEEYYAGGTLEGYEDADAVRRKSIGAEGRNGEGG